MSTHFIFPKPKDWDTLEDIVCDVFARKFNNYNLQRYGRGGQRQDGVDIAGHTHEGLLGIQCKHHPKGNIPINEIDEEIVKSEGFQPRLDKLFIATSADRDTKAHAYVLQVNKERRLAGKHPVIIKFWEDIYNWLIEFPDLVYKHFTKYFPAQELEEIRVSSATPQPKTTVCWPTTLENLADAIKSTLGNLEPVNPYRPTIGFTSFTSVSYKGQVDLELPMADLFVDEASSEADFIEARKILNEVKSVLGAPFFSKELWVHLQTRLTPAFLFGWVFRRVTHFDLRLIFSNQIWATSGLPLIPSRITDNLPKLIAPDSDEVVVVLNISRSIEGSVIGYAHKWRKQPKAVLVYDLESNRITSAAHALSIALEISRKIKTLIDKGQVSRIHLFGAMPAALATLISFNLNAICPISIYYLDGSRTQYRLGGTLTNRL